VLLPAGSSRKPRVILVFLIALCGVFVYSYTARLSEKSDVDAQIVAMQARIEGAKNEQYKLLNEREDLNQPDFLDRTAREDFGMVKPGDKLLVIVDEAAESAKVNDVTVAAAAATNLIDYRNSPIWKQWVVFFTTASFTNSLQ
jgi:cell division protein FtsB